MRDRRFVAVTCALAGFVFGAVTFYLAFVADWTELSAEEERCAGYVQGRIAWNEDGNTRWDPSAVANLCRGATRPAQPGLCFDSVFNASLDKGAAIQEDWKDAVALCAGTDAAQARVACYKSEIEQGAHFRDAIETCNPPPEIAGRTACERLVQGNIAWNEDGDTAWTPRRLDLLCADTTRPTQPLICFDRLYHGNGPWKPIVGGNWRRAALLCAGTNSVRAATDCVTSQIAEVESQDAAMSRLRAEQTFRSVLNACNPRRPPERSDRCKEFVQGNIPWSAQGYTDWQPEVLDELCGQTRAPQQPGLCFFRAMSGDIEDDRKGLSKWAYAVRLCAGANDAQARLSCYRREREADNESRAAIAACKDAEDD